MDLVGACRAFVAVSDHGGFTDGAAAAGVSQPVASRRVAALEERLGEPLFERSVRRAVLTPFGREMLPHARRLVEDADGLLHEAAAARRRPWKLAVPETCTTGGLARLVARARGLGMLLDPRPARPARRGELLLARRVRAALLAVPEQEAAWPVPLGLAAARDPGVRRVHLETLRLGRTARGPARRVWLQPEDDVPHVRDPLAQLRDAVGLRPAQLALAPDTTTAVAEILAAPDLLLCSAAQACHLGLHWRPLGEYTPVRGYLLGLAADSGPEPPLSRLGEEIGACVGASTPGDPADERDGG
ncbi:LysR family transcriptional regulator [Streptomyces solincola]|uniref:LysR family transcriptional regulator n=1 Tax=Streptomyces solincola TaxID=2100817 RepID=A0A2S9Q1T7_9ACTN|nr:LysR family transcriptional regulator [Streptomyces solincola]PRH80634.1 LysR family transcriptional regulator [Streptomyces solincola]